MSTHSFRQIIRRCWESTRVALKVTHPITAIVSGDKDVATPGTRVTLAASSIPIAYVDIQAKEDNTDVVVVGSVTVVAALATRIGLALTPLSSVRIQIDDLQDIYLDALQANDGVTFIYYT